MTHESEQNAASEAVALPVKEENKPAAGRYAPGSAQDRLAKMPPDELKKTYRDARFLADMRNFLGMTIFFHFRWPGFKRSIFSFFSSRKKLFLFSPFYCSAPCSGFPVSACS